MSANATVLQMHHREAFERNVTRALAVGAGAGALAFAVQKAGVSVPLMYLALAGTSLACVRGDKMDRLLLGGLSVVLPALPWVLGLSVGWTVALAAAAVGALMVKSRVCEKGEEGSVGSGRPGLFNFALGAAGCAGLSVAGYEVAKVLGARLSDFSTPPLIASVVSGVVVALFAAIGSIAAHLALKPDPVEARCEELLPQLSGEFQVLGQRALNLYRQCGQSLALLPREPAREELARTLSKMTKDAVELAADWSGVEAQLEEDAQKDLSKEVLELTRSAATSKDAVAKRQLELAAESLREELERLGELKLRRERILAKLRAEVALLERARVALIGVRSGQAQLKAAELSALARKFKALSTLQSDEGKLAEAVATGAELAHVEAESGRMEPIAPVEAAAEAEAAPAKERMKG
ncbi:MAG: hypothetical protein HYZ28_24210 [Myxococcales bacterium]|nr:hypothetical protein [Myxococcales bacterium]